MAQTAKGISNVKVSEHMRCNPSQIASWRYCDDMMFSNVKKLAELFELSLDELDELGR
jgi:hypothetical protein